MIQNDENLSGEPDWQFYQWAYRIEKELKEKARLTGPKTESDWLEIFPEAKKVIPVKLKDWENRAETARILVNRAIELVKNKSQQEYQWFWMDFIKYTFQPTQEFIEAKRQLKRLQWAVPTKKKKIRMTNFKYQLEKAKTQDILHVAQIYGLPIKKSGLTYKTLCPKHSEKTASFCIYPPTHYVCFGCSVKGDVISFVQLIDNCSFKEAVLKLQNI